MSAKTATLLTDAAGIARAAGIDVDFDAGWRTRGRAGLAPRGQVNHTTEDPAPLTTARMLAIVRNGHGAIAGNAIYNTLIPRHGPRVIVVAAGVAWHAGRGSYAGWSGNSRWFGCAYQRAVGQQLTDEQLHVGRVWDAALCEAAGWDPLRLLPEHFEYAEPAGRKSDRLERNGRRVDADRWRRQVAALLTPSRPPSAPSPRWLLCDHLAGGPADHDIPFGRHGDIPISGDWNGDGRTTLGMFRDGRWMLRNSLTSGPADVSFTFGRPGDIPVVGRWTGSRTYVGVRRGNRWLLRLAHAGGPADLDIAYGRPDDLPVVGDWNGTGRDTIGVVRLERGRGPRWLLRDHLAGGPADHDFVYGATGDLPVVGRWDGRRTGVGVRRGNRWLLRNRPSAGAADHPLTYGRPADLPIVGDWTGHGHDTIGVVR